MKPSKIQRKLIAVAKHHPPGDQVPYAFEKRIMARLESLPKVSAWSLWGKPLWQAAGSCVALTALCGIWSFATVKASDSDTLSQDFETAVYATMNQHVEDTW